MKVFLVFYLQSTLKVNDTVVKNITWNATLLLFLNIFLYEARSITLVTVEKIQQDLQYRSNVWTHFFSFFKNCCRNWTSGLKMFVLCLKCFYNTPKQIPEDLVPIRLFMHPLQPLTWILEENSAKFAQEIFVSCLQSMFRNVWSILELQMVIL